MQPPLYSIPVLPQSLRREEMVVQTADALQHLCNVSKDIFNRINKRIETNTAALSSISSRIEEAHLKVSKLRGATKATQVFSSSKYPAADIHHSYKSVFVNDHNVCLTPSKVNFKNTPIYDDFLEGLQFYHVNMENKSEENTPCNGLGDVPVDVVAVNDILLYNTGKNPYANYVISDPLQASSRSKKETLENVSTIAAAPHSLAEKTTLNKSATDSYLYLPDLGNVPVIDVPLDLPDLPGIADDLRYTDEAGPGIAPSVTTLLVPDLPPLNENKIVYDSPSLIPTLHPVTIPELQEIPEECPQIESKEPEHVEEPVNTKPSANTTKELPIVNDAHANLMEAIRKAGGSTSSKVKISEPKKPPAGDLMADLHAKLSLRRKGISGVNNPDLNANTGNIDSNTTMQKISAMIPPPPVTVEQSDSTNTEDEDWDD